MKRLRPALACGWLAAMLAWGALAPAVAAAAPPASPTTDCTRNDNRLTAHYSNAQLQQALNTIPPSVKEYTGCYSVIQQQLYKQLGRSVPSTGGSSGGGSSGTVIVIVVIVVIVLGGGSLALYAYRRSPTGDGRSGPPPPVA